VIIVDDYQEATAATARLLAVLRGQGTRLVLLGDPDVAVQGFRGALPSLVGQASAGDPSQPQFSRERLGQFGARQFVLEQVYRGPRELREVVRRVTGSIGSVGVVSHRRADSVLAPDRIDPGESAVSTSDATNVPAVQVCTFDTEALEVAYIARLLRSAHLRDKTPWTDMAVIARSGSALLAYRRLLAQAGVPVAVVGTDIPLRDEPAVRPLLNAVRASAHDVELDEALDLLASVIGGVDVIGIRKLRRALRREELQGGGGRTSDQLILEALNNPDWPASLGAVGRPLERVARVLAAGRRALTQPNATAQTVLWAVWDAAGLAEPWQRTALTGGAASARADRDLDAVMSLFRAAETYVDRLPESSALEFIDFIESQDIPADSLSQQVALGGKVTLVTPAGAAGRSWPIVVVAGVQEGQWPDLRLRDSLLGAQTLVEVLSGRSDSARGLGPGARREVFYDELRAFALSVSRATQRLVVTAVRDDEQEPSVFLNLVSPAPDDAEALSDVAHTHVSVQASDIPLDLRGITALARAEMMGALETGEEQTTTDRARLLKYLNEHGVLVARPHNWYGALGLSSAAQLFSHRDTVPVSPSRVESVGRCALRWSLETAGGVPASGLSQSVGTLVHAIAAQYPRGRLHELKAELDRQWPNLRLGEGLSANLQYERAVTMIEKLASFFSQREKEGLARVEVEVPFTVEIEGAHITGVVDRLEIDDTGAARVIDLKTGKQAPTQAKTSVNPQLGIYQLAVLDGAFGASQQPNGAELVLVGTDTKDVTLRRQEAITDPAHNWARDVVRDAVGVMRSNTFTATRNDMCQVCPVRRSCPLQNEGQHVIPMGVTEIRTVQEDTAGKETQA
jgi:superfamily I DNA/RNA helicase/RecB family exonuclease